MTATELWIIDVCICLQIEVFLKSKYTYVNVRTFSIILPIPDYCEILDILRLFFTFLQLSFVFLVESCNQHSYKKIWKVFQTCNQSTNIEILLLQSFSPKCFELQMQIFFMCPKHKIWIEADARNFPCTLNSTTLALIVNSGGFWMLFERGSVYCARTF